MSFQQEYSAVDVTVSRATNLYRLFLDKQPECRFEVRQLGARGTIKKLSLDASSKAIKVAHMLIEWDSCGSLNWPIHDPYELIEAFNKFGIRILTPLERLAEAANDEDLVERQHEF